MPKKAGKPATPPEIKTDRHYLEVLRSLSMEAVVGSTSTKRLAHLVKIVATELDWDVCSIYILEPESNELVLAATHGLSSKSVGKVRLPISQGLVGSAFSEEGSIFLENAAQDPRFKYFPETREEKFHSLGAVPLSRAGKVIGVLTVQTVGAYKFSTADTHFLEILASQIGQAVDIALSLRSIGKAQPVILVGVPVSPGVGEARVHLLAASPDQVEYLARGFRGLKFEQDLFNKALDLAIQEMDNLAGMLDKSSTPAANIFLAHKMILKDQEFLRKVREGMKAREESAPRVVASVMGEYIEKFSSYESKTMREKAQDLKDLRDTLLRLMGEKVTQLEPKFEEDQMVLVARELTPQQTVRLNTTKVSGIVTELGGEYSHAAILARALNLPAVLGVSGITDTVRPGDKMLVDGNSGFVYINPDARIKGKSLEKSKALKKRADSIRSAMSEPVGTAPSLYKNVTVDANIGIPFEIDQAIREEFGSVGLFRTEFYYMSQTSWPDEEAQSNFYERLLRFFPNGSVTIRLIDIGGDKFLSYMPELKVENSAMGFRSVRLLLDHPEILRSQLKAIHRASEASGLVPRILVPMVTHTWEITAVRETLLEVTGGKDYPLGIMVETPAVLFEIEELLAEADFLSVGTNDLAQYLLAVDRNDPRVNHLYHPLHMALLRALDHLFKSMAVFSKPFSVCGEMAGDPLTVLALLVLGYRRFSLSPSRAPEIKYLLRKIPESVLFKLRAPLLRASDPKDSEKQLRAVIRKHAPLLA
ncbi:MAG: phosphoenolpyruvate--protein phosphotransferase [Nitrospinae bacterium]|nr:phosphoenolpyruvate--protein phosphotransferase [Nitrospinota bacterium]